MEEAIARKGENVASLIATEATLIRPIKLPISFLMHNVETRIRPQTIQEAYARTRTKSASFSVYFPPSSFSYSSAKKKSRAPIPENKVAESKLDIHIRGPIEHGHTKKKTKSSPSTKYPPKPIPPTTFAATMKSLTTLSMKDANAKFLHCAISSFAEPITASLKVSIREEMDTGLLYPLNFTAFVLNIHAPHVTITLKLVSCKIQFELQPSIFRIS